MLGIRVGGKIVNVIRYGDDKAVVASLQKGLQELMNRLNAVIKEYGMICVTKTKVMCMSQKGKNKVRILIDDQQVEQVSQFNYLGRWISDNGYATKDIMSKNCDGQDIVQGQEKLLTGKLSCEQKKRIVKITVWNVALYAAET